MGLRAQEAKEA